MGDVKIMDKNILKIRNLVKQYDNSQNVILKGIDLDLNEEDFLCILGPSGCGKSTMIRCIAGFEGYEGTIEVSGEKVTKPGPDRIMVFQDFNQLFPWKTVLGNITYPLKVGGMKDKEERKKRAEKYLEKVNLSQYKDYYPHQLSGGMKQRVAIAKGLALGSKIILMDEPSMGLSPIMVNEIFDIIRAVSESGTTVLLVEQNAKKALSIADRAYVLETGKIVLSGDAKELLEDDSIKKAYLGE